MVARFALWLGLALVFPAVALAQVPPLAGFQKSFDEGALIFTAAVNSGGARVVYSLLKPEEPKGMAVEFWFDTRADAIAKGIGTVMAQTKPSGLGDYLISIAAIKTADGVETQAVILGYETAAGNQIGVILFPASLSGEDARVKSAHAHFQAMAKGRLINSGQAEP